MWATAWTSPLKRRRAKTQRHQERASWCGMRHRVRLATLPLDLGMDGRGRRFAAKPYRPPARGSIYTRQGETRSRGQMWSLGTTSSTSWVWRERALSAGVLMREDGARHCGPLLQCSHPGDRCHQTWGDQQPPLRWDEGCHWRPPPVACICCRYVIHFPTPGASIAGTKACGARLQPGSRRGRCRRCPRCSTQHRLLPRALDEGGQRLVATAAAMGQRKGLSQAARPHCLRPNEAGGAAATRWVRKADANGRCEHSAARGCVQECCCVLERPVSVPPRWPYAPRVPRRSQAITR